MRQNPGDLEKDLYVLTPSVVSSSAMGTSTSSIVSNSTRKEREESEKVREAQQRGENR
jgi:hypothetical protein